MSIESKNIPRLLRQIGVVSLVASGASFLLQGWYHFNSLQRYLCFVAFSAALTLLGYWCGNRWGETKGARTFLALAAATLPVHFAQLGAIIWEQFSGSAHLVGFISLGLVALGGTLLALPMARLGLASLQRSEARNLWQQYFLLNLLLLPPVRTGGLVGFLAVVGLAIAMLYRQAFSRNPAPDTIEACIAHSMSASPLLVLLVRGFLYSQPLSVLSSFFLVSAGFLFFFLPRLPKWNDFRGLCEWASMPFFAAGWMSLANEISNHLPGALSLSVILLPVTLFMIALSFATDSSQAPRFRTAGSYGALFVQLFQLAVGNGTVAAPLAILVGALLISVSINARQKDVLWTGTAVAVAGMGYEIWLSFGLLVQDAWITLGILGFAILLLAVLFEKYSQSLYQGVARVRVNLSRWD